MARYVVHVIDSETKEEGYLKWGHVVSFKGAFPYPHPSSARRALERFTRTHNCAGSIVDLRSVRK